MPLSFEANQGQVNAQVDFLLRGSGYTLFLTPREAVLLLRSRGAPLEARSQRPVSAAVLRIQLAGANANPRLAGLDKLPGKVNYFIGNDPSRWRTNIPTYTKVAYQDVYPGIDLIYHGTQGQLEYDFIVRPGADPGGIALAFQGADRLEVNAQGDLVLHTAIGPVRQPRPVIYQKVNGLRREIVGGYVIKGPQQVTFHIAAYDHSRPLVIDPVLLYSTYLGGGGDEQSLGIAVDASGNAYVMGTTSSVNFPTTTGSFDTTYNGNNDAFVTKLNPTGSGLVYSTYLGGSGTEEAAGDIAIDLAGNTYIIGRTASSDFPTTTGAFDTTLGGVTDAFVTKLNPTGSGLVYSTYLGGSGGEDRGRDIAVDLTGHAHVTGDTSATDFPTTTGAFDTTFNGGLIDAWITRLDPTGSMLVYSTFLGGGGRDFGSGISVDLAGNVYVTGPTDSTNFPTTTGAFDTAYNGGIFDAFVTKVDLTPLAPLLYSTYLGGSGTDESIELTIDSGGNAYVTGYTSSPNFPTTIGAYDTTFNGSLDAFVTKLNPAGTAPAFSTYLGGSGVDVGVGIAVDLAGNTYVTGTTSSTNFPTTAGACDTSLNGSSDAFVTKLDLIGSGLVYSTYLGGSASEAGRSIALDALPIPNAHVTGVTSSTDFPTTTGAFDTTYNSGGDAFVAKIIDGVLPCGGAIADKVTGGGSINVVGGIGTFGFVVQRQAADGSIHGQLQYVNHVTKAKVHSVAITSFVAAGNGATFSGTCTINGAPCTFSVQVQDNGEPGTNDAFTIAVVVGSTEGGTLRSGNIQVHQ